MDVQEFAGTVVAAGPQVLRAGRFGVGDRVAGFVHGMYVVWKPRLPAVASITELTRR